MSTDLVKSQTSLTLTDEMDRNALAGFAMAKQRFAVIMQLREYAIKHTHPQHWTDQDGKPFLNSHGTDFVERAFGVESTVKNKERQSVEDEEGSYYLWTFIVASRLPGSEDTVEALGIASSRDKFFGTETRSGRTIKQVNECNIAKKAWTDARRTALQRMFDLRGISWGELEHITGGNVAKSKCTGVSYKKGEK